MAVPYTYICHCAHNNKLDVEWSRHCDTFISNDFFRVKIHKICDEYDDMIAGSAYETHQWERGRSESESGTKKEKLRWVEENRGTECDA